MPPRYTYIIQAHENGQPGHPDTWHDRHAALHYARTLYFSLPAPARVDVYRYMEDTDEAARTRHAAHPCAPYVSYTTATPPRRRSKSVPRAMDDLHELAARIAIYADDTGQSVASACAQLAAETGIATRTVQAWIYDGATPTRLTSKIANEALEKLEKNVKKG